MVVVRGAQRLAHCVAIRPDDAFPLCAEIAPAITGPSTICAGETATLVAEADFTAYLWSPGGEATVAITVTPIATTGYRVTVTDADDCSGTSSEHVVTVLPCGLLFADGFERGDTSAWSGTVGGR